MTKQALFKDVQGEPLTPVAILGFSQVFGIAADGTISSNSFDFMIDHLRTTHDRAIDRRTEVSLGSKKLELTAGAGVILGRPYSGKTLLSDTLRYHNSDRVQILRFREPEIDSLLHEANLVREFYMRLENPAVDVIVIDSLRTTFYSTSGATGKGGVNMGIFALLTAYDIIARRHGKVVLFTLNPMTTDDDAIAFYLEAVKGSVSHAIYTPEPLRFTISSRAFTTRDEKRFVYVPPKGDGSAKAVGFAERAPVELTFGGDSLADLYIMN